MGALIVEDDYEFEMSFLRAPLPALKSLDGDGRVIHVGSFSKSIFPGLRLGYLVGSEAFIREARALRASVLRHPPGHIQRTAAYFLSLGHYDSLIRRMGQILAERRRVMEEAAARSRRADRARAALFPFRGSAAKSLPPGLLLDPGRADTAGRRAAGRRAGRHGDGRLIGHRLAEILALLPVSGSD